MRAINLPLLSIIHARRCNIGQTGVNGIAVSILTFTVELLDASGGYW